MSQLKTDRRGLRAFSLVEVLIALLVLSTGLLALANLQIKSLQTSHQAYLLTQATLQAHDMAERMKSNIAYSYKNISNVSSKPDCHLRSCFPEEIAQYDIYEWQQNIKSLLPEGTGTITKSTANSFSIKINWLNKADPQNNHSVQLEFDL